MILVDEVMSRTALIELALGSWDQRTRCILIRMELRVLRLLICELLIKAIVHQKGICRLLRHHHLILHLNTNLIKVLT